MIEHVEISGLRIAFERLGEGPPIVLLHGALSDHREWSAQLELADEFAVVAWDAPGSGGSSDPPSAFRMPDFADCLAGFVEALALDRPTVVGLSFGATLALQLGCRHPGVAGALVPASAYAGWAGSLPPAEVAERRASVLRLLEQGPGALADAFLETLFAHDTPPETVENMTAIMADLRPAATNVILEAMAECDLRAALPAIEVPTLLLHGELDARSPLRAAEEIRDAIPGSVLTVLPRAGHQLNVEAAREFTAEVRAFLRSLSGQ